MTVAIRAFWATGSLPRGSVGAPRSRGLAVSCLLNPYAGVPFLWTKFREATRGGLGKGKAPDGRLSNWTTRGGKGRSPERSPTACTS